MTTTERLPRTRNGNPRMRLTTHIYPYWLERLHFRYSELTNEYVEICSLRYHGDTIFHYGSHFPLGEIIRDSRGRARLVLLNGDSWGGNNGFGPSTSARQSELRTAVAGEDIESIILPFTALSQAGIEHSSIRPIHVRPDRDTFHERSSDVRPKDRYPATMEDPSGATHAETRYDYGDASTGYQYRGSHEVQVPNRVPDPRRTGSFQSGHGWSEGAELRDDGKWHWTERRHWLGDSVFRARVTETRWRKPTAQEQANHDANMAWHQEEERLRDITRRLQHDYFNAKDGRSEWDHQERSYFLAEPANPERALELRKELTASVEAQREHSMEHPPHSVVVARNGRVAYSVRRWATYLSSFDYQEAAPLYFMAELPYGANPTTVDEAINALKPPEVVAAEARGLEVIRQGDLFAIPTKLTAKQIRRLRGRRTVTKRLRVLGTNHSVSEGVICKGGVTLGRGIMRHEPVGWRRPDHARQTLGDRKTWHLLVRNTVPRSR